MQRDCWERLSGLPSSELIGSGARSFYGGIFTAVVRAPVTGIILVMMGSFALFLPMLGACFAAIWCRRCCAIPPMICFGLSDLCRPGGPRGIADFPPTRSGMR